MATTDTIAFVKESKTCAYVLVVHTPRLCGEPGFMTKDAGEQASISCREIVSGALPDRSEPAFLSAADHPLQKPRRKPVLPLPPPAAPGTIPKDTSDPKYGALRKAFDTLWGKASGDLEMVEDDNGNIMISLDLPLDGEGDHEAAELAARNRIEAIMANLNIKGSGSAASAEGKSSKNKKNKNNGDEKQDANDAADRRREVDELL